MKANFVSFGRFSPGLLLAWLSLALNVFAQSPRDPTVPPPALGMPAAGADAPVGLALVAGQVSVLQRDGVYYLVLGSRIYAPGQMIGITKIERVTETEVWLQDNGSVRKVPVFGGITRRSLPQPPAPLAVPPVSPAVDWVPGAEFEL